MMDREEFCEICGGGPEKLPLRKVNVTKENGTEKWRKCPYCKISFRRK